METITQLNDQTLNQFIVHLPRHFQSTYISDLIVEK